MFTTIPKGWVEVTKEVFEDLMSSIRYQRQSFSQVYYYAVDYPDSPKAGCYDGSTAVGETGGTYWVDPEFWKAAHYD